MLLFAYNMVWLPLLLGVPQGTVVRRARQQRRSMAHEGWLGELWVAWLLPCGRAALRFASALALAVVLTLRIPSVSRTYACMHAYIHACIHICMLTCSHAHAAHPECEQPCTLHTYVCVHVYIYTYMHTCIHAHVCTQVSSLSAWDVVLASYAAAIAEAAATQVCHRRGHA